MTVTDPYWDAGRLRGLVSARLADQTIGWPQAKRYHAMIDQATDRADLERCGVIIRDELAKLPVVFTITRASLYGRDSFECVIDEPAVAPHPRATPRQIQTYRYFTFATIAEANDRYPNLEFEEVDGRIRSPGRPETQWVITITGLADLLDLGRIVIEQNWENHQQRHIQICDASRE